VLNDLKARNVRLDALASEVDSIAEQVAQLKAVEVE
jgi:hypothetical protein